MITALPHGVVLDTGAGGLPRLTIATGRCSAEMYLHGAHLCRWQPDGHPHPVLWMSRRSWFDTGKPIRGGVPVCFPWFGPRSGAPKAPGHGFARTQPWTLDSVTSAPDGAVLVTLSLGANDVSRAYVENVFELRYAARIGADLSLSLTVVNKGATPLVFEQALHTYLTVHDVRQVDVTGLAGATYIDKADGGARKREGPEPIRIAAETDRLYLDTEASVTLADPGLQRRIIVSKTGSRSSVVWNPWVAKSAAMPDFGDDEWPGMLCIETANAGDNLVRVLPGGSHEMTTHLTVLPR
jgi:glucose-6-phosphate 1-epimerase